MSERIWYEDLSGFITNDTYFRIVPVQSMTIEEKLNALVRFFIYVGLLLALLKSEYKFLFFGIIASLISVVLYEFEKNKRRRAEKFLTVHDLDIVENKVCTRSTIDNPFMNPSLLDIHRDDRPQACATDHPRVQSTIEKNFEARLFRDASDLFGKMASQRQFYTVPAHDQATFAQWLYGKGPSCKEGNGFQCEENLMEDVQRRPGQSSASQV